jgi:hypothetical protein
VLPCVNPCTKNWPTLVVVTPGKVIVVPPATVPSVLTTAIAGPLLVTVTVTALGGAVSRIMFPNSCKFLPTSAVGNPLFEKNAKIFGAVTVAVPWRELLGVLNPVGTPILTTLVPAFNGWKNAVELKAPPPWNVTGLVVIVPTVVSLLVMGTCTVNPPRTACPRT